MPNYIRARFPGGYYFFTVVTYKRKRIFHHEASIELIKSAIEQAQYSYPFETVASCLLPDHIHCIWKLPDDDVDFSRRWSFIKSHFSRNYHANHKRSNISVSRINKGEVAVWQRRFWEHQIRDERDLQKHVDYIHYNPVKHGYVEEPEDWSESSYLKFVEKGFYKGHNIKVRVKNIENNTGFGE